MSLEAIYYLSQTVAAVLLFISIVFVGIQIQQNTKATRAASAYEVMKTWGVFNGERSTDLASIKIMKDLVDKTKVIQDFGPIEQLQMSTFVNSLVQFWSGQYFLFKEGSLPRAYWELNGSYAGNFMRLPIVHEIVEQQKSARMTTPEFFIEVARLGKLYPTEISALDFWQEKAAGPPKSDV